MNQSHRMNASRTARLIQGFCLSTTALLITACGGGGDDAPNQATNPIAPTAASFAGGAVNLDFSAQANNTSIDCGTALISNLGSTTATARLQDLRFYVSNVRFVRIDGTEQRLALNVASSADPWNVSQGSDSLTLIDLENNTGTCATGSGTDATNGRVAGTLPPGNYQSVRFDVGVPYVFNHLDPTDPQTPLALSSTSLGWSWTTGRIFAKIEVTDPQRNSTPTWTAPVFTAHLGAGGCSGDPAAGTPAVCTRPNLATVTLGTSAAPFDPTQQRVIIDVAALVAGNDVTANGGGPSGCMSSPTDPECPLMFQALALDLSTGLPVNGGQAQTVFRSAAR